MYGLGDVLCGVVVFVALGASMSEFGSPLGPFEWPSGVGDDEKGVGRHRGKENTVLGGRDVFRPVIFLPDLKKLICGMW